MFESWESLLKTIENVNIHHAVLHIGMESQLIFATVVTWLAFV